MNFPMVNKSVTTEVRKVEIELAASLWRHCSTATTNLRQEWEAYLLPWAAWIVHCLNVLTLIS